MRHLDWIIIFAAGTAFGASFGLNEVLLRELGPLTISALRIGIAALGCWAWMLARERSAMVLDLTGTRLVALGLFQFALPFALLPYAQMHITSSVAGIANALTPVATTLLSLLWFTSDRISPAKALGLGFGAMGTIVLLSGSGAETESNPIFVILAIVATFSYALALNIAKNLGAVPATAAITWALTFGFALIAPTAVYFEGMPHALSFSTITSITVLGLGLTALPFMVLYTLMKRIGAMNVSLVTFVAPVSALLIGVLFLGEAVTTANLVGVVLIMFGLASIDGRLVNRLRLAGARTDRTRARLAWGAYPQNSNHP